MPILFTMQLMVILGLNYGAAVRKTKDVAITAIHLVVMQFLMEISFVQTAAKVWSNFNCTHNKLYFEYTVLS